MNQVRVNRETLLDKLRENRDNHRAIFEEAQEAYREQAIEALDQMLEDAKRGKKIKRGINLPKPEDHTQDYNRIIAMVDMSVDDEIMLSQVDFGRYVLDQWEWKASWTNSTANYTAYSPDDDLV